MAVSVLTNAKVWLGQYDFSGDHNQIAVAYEADAKDVTTFGDTTHEFIGGLKGAGFSGGGFWQAGTGAIDTIAQGNIGTNNILTTIAPVGTDGEAAYFMRALHARYSFGGPVGEVAPFTLEGRASDTLVRGTVMHNNTRTATGTGTARQLGAVSATQKLYAALHVFTVSGTSPTLDVIVQSDDAVGMASPTSRITFTRATAATSQWATPVSGAITDTYWRVSYTIGGTSPSFLFAVVVGIL